MSRVKRAEVFIGRDGLAYFVAIYGNNKRGPRSEGYGRSWYPRALKLRLAKRYAKADYGDIEIKVVGVR